MILLISILGFSIGGNFFGINYWYFEKLSQEEKKMVEDKLKALEIDTIRIGGLWYDANGINSWVLEDFFRLCDDLDATPIVQIPLNSHSVDEMLSFVSKVRKMYNGRVIWSIGNEPDIYQRVSFSWVKKESLKEVMRKYREFLKRFDRKGDMVMLPDITVVWRNARLLTPFLNLNPDVFSIHRYPFNNVRNVKEIFRDLDKFYREILNLRKLLNLPIALTETNLSWNWNFHGYLSPEGPYAALWMISVYLRAIALNIWNVSTWSTINDSSLSMLMFKNGEIVERPVYEFLQVFKGIPRNLKEYGLSKDVDWVILGRSLIAVNRSDEIKLLDIHNHFYRLMPLSVERFDENKKVFERRIEK